MEQVGNVEILVRKLEGKRPIGDQMKLIFEKWGVRCGEDSSASGWIYNGAFNIPYIHVRS